MTVLIVAIGIIFFLIGLFCFALFVSKAFKAVCYYFYYRYFASDRKLTDAYFEKIASKKEDFKKHSKSVDSVVNDILQK